MTTEPQFECNWCGYIGPKIGYAPLQDALDAFGGCPSCVNGTLVPLKENDMSEEKKIRLLGDRVIIKRDKAEEKIGSIIVPDAAQEKPQRGIVVAVGPGKLLDNGVRVEPSVKKDDRVLFGKYAGQERGRRFDPEADQVIVREDDIIGVFE